VVLVLAVGGMVWYQSNRKDTRTAQKESVPVQTADVAPGQFKAKLTLADGSVVVLDTVSNKQVVQQGSTNVYTKDGKLIYQHKGENKEVLYNTLTTAKGETFGMELSDGSKVWLNSQSSIRYPVAFNSEVRKVEITGEAYFEVATAYLISGSGQKEKLPFVVSANGMEVQVLGTKFNVNSYSDENSTRTTL
jgi:ferric-dicitrate binding protein FerR (iron transport regulator)